MSYDLSKIPTVDVSVKIPKSDYEARCAKLRSEMEKRGIDIGFTFGSPFMPGDVMYLTGYDPVLENNMVMISKDKVFLLCGQEGSYCARFHIMNGEIKIILEMNIPTEEYINTGSTTVKDLIKEVTPHGVKRIGILTREDVFSVDALNSIKNAAGSMVDFVDASDIIYNMRFEKSIAEQAVLRVANRISIEAVKAMCESVEPGMREFEVMAIGDYVMKKMGATCLGFDSFIQSGDRSNCVMGRASDRVIKKGEPVKIGTAARYEGYSSTAQRMTVAGGFTQEFVDFYEIVAQAHEIGRDHFVCGQPRADLERAVCDFWKKHDLLKYKVFSSAHGTGISECMEGIAFTLQSTELIPKNCAMMIDCGLFDVPKFHGVSIESPYLINDKGEREDLACAYYPLRNWLL